MHKYLKYGWLDNLDTVRRIPFGQLWGVRLSLTPTVWLFPFVFWLIRLVQDFFGPSMAPAERVYYAVIFMLDVTLYTGVHALGHIAGGKLAGSAMDELLFTSTRAVNIYQGDQSRIPPKVHIIRSFGGPLANLLCAALLFGLTPLASGGLADDLIRSGALSSLIGGLAACLPLPSLDGQVIWREVVRSLRPRKQQRSA